MPTLLVADDSITVQRVIALTFANEQIRVVAVSDGTQAVERMKTLHPDIVLAGTVLPQVSGYALAKHMRTIPGLRNVPVLLLAGAFETVDEQKLKESGANGILEKPVEPNNVIARVKELLGLKSDAKSATGRLVTPADGPVANPMPVAAVPEAVTSTIGMAATSQEPVDQPGVETTPESVEDASAGPHDYLDTLDAAFDTLDQQLSGRVSGEKPSRNPSGPLGHSSGASDPRSPGRGPGAGASAPAPGNPVFEVDDEWFGGDESQARADARAGRRDVQEDLSNPALQAPLPDAATPAAVFELEDNWFADADKARAAKLEDQRAMAVEMGIHDVVLPHAEPVPAESPAVADQFRHLLPSDLRQPTAADRGPAGVQVVAPEVTAEMLDQVAARVADRLSTGGFGEQLMNSVTATVRDSVREIATEVSERLSREIAISTSERISREIASETSDRLVREIATEASVRVARDIVSDTSERLVRDEIERIKSKARS